MKSDQMGTRTAHPSPQELLLSNGTRFSLSKGDYPAASCFDGLSGLSDVSYVRKSKPTA